MCFRKATDLPTAEIVRAVPKRWRTGCAQLPGDWPLAELLPCLCPICQLTPGRAFGSRDQGSRNSLHRQFEQDGKFPRTQAFESAAAVAETNGSALVWRLPSRAQPGAP